MLVRLACCVVLVAVSLMPPAARADCADEISKVMSKDTEKLTTRYNKIAKQIQTKGASPKLVAEECKIARQLGPRLEDQLTAIKQSGCTKDPQMGNMIADIVRGYRKRLHSALTNASSAIEGLDDPDHKAEVLTAATSILIRLCQLDPTVIPPPIGPSPLPQRCSCESPAP